MKSHQMRALQAYRRIEAWFADHPQVIANSGSSAPALASQLDALKEVVTTMTDSATEQTMQKGQATLAAKDEEELRTKLRSLHLKAIVKVAAALRGEVPGTGVFKLPSDNLSSEGLLHDAVVLRKTAAIYKDVFVEHGLPADFLDRLDAAMTALKASVDARGVARSRVAGASTGVKGDLKAGRKIVGMMDASLTHALETDPATLASWRQAKRVTVKGVSTRGNGRVLPIDGGGGSPATGGAPVTQVAAPTVAPGVPIPPNAVPVVSSAGPQAPGAGSVAHGEASPAQSTVPAATSQEIKAA